MKKILIKNATLINEGYAGIASVLIEGDEIAAVCPEECTIEMERNADEVVDAFGKWLLPGVIDDQVHFREPGLTYKADMHLRIDGCGGRRGDFLYGNAEYEPSNDNERGSRLEI